MAWLVGWLRLSQRGLGVWLGVGLDVWGGGGGWWGGGVWGGGGGGGLEEGLYEVGEGQLWPINKLALHVPRTCVCEAALSHASFLYLCVQGSIPKQLP